ncbi:unnamed protein product [Gemmata massiliana]|uniref:Uncharacterized protein n=1 Tax=Gemmata massiliana TaxID=1210884 RepID=A0A6P2CWI6_9BACT|nr:hypothetical protein [Gemmata massiliana]VTR93263.1 unnamed protein product [Gemmata massiliana]
MTEPTSRQHKAITAVALAVLGCCAGLIAFGDRPFNGVRVEQLKADLNERLPEGSSWADGEAWFARHSIRPGVVFKVSDNLKTGLAATVPNSSLINNAEIYIELHFGAGGKLEKKTVYRFVYSL